jgi:DNA mismatch repair protein MutH
MKRYQNKEELLEDAQNIIGRSLREYISTEISQEKLCEVEKEVAETVKRKHKGLLGFLVQENVFDRPRDNRARADFDEIGVELKTTPLKMNKDESIVAKERISFSMINYEYVVHETWESSSFLAKNQKLLILFYMWLKDVEILDYEFKYSHFLNLLEDISSADILQIQRDWEFITQKVKDGKAHMLSEGDTFYLGACTKGADNTRRRPQPYSDIDAKPRAFSLKQSYLTRIIKKMILKEEEKKLKSLFDKIDEPSTIEEIVTSRFEPYIGKSVDEIQDMVGIDLVKMTPKQHFRLLVEQLMDAEIDKIEEFEKANIIMRVMALEVDGKLKENISFPAFEYCDLVEQKWYGKDGENISDLYEQLDSQKFFFVVFQKTQDGSAFLKKTMFWNFPQDKMDAAREVWEETQEIVREGNIVRGTYENKNGKTIRQTNFPGVKKYPIVHARPHAKTTMGDVSKLPVRDKYTGDDFYTKYSFWFGRNFIRDEIKRDELDQI